MLQRYTMLVSVCLVSFVGQTLADPQADIQLLQDSKIPTDGPGLFDFFKKRSQRDENKIKQLIRQLGDDDFERREQASQALVAIGAPAKTLLTQAKTNDDVEIARRAEECLVRIDQGATEQVLAAAIRHLAQQKQPGTAGLFLDYLLVGEFESLNEEVRKQLPRVAILQGKADPTLVAALADPSPVKRGAAGAALARAGATDQQDAIRKLLTDPDPSVRYRLGLALIGRRDRDAVPTLIDLLAEPNLASRERSLLEDLLYRLADDQPLGVPPGDSPEDRKKIQEAWRTWWKEANTKIDPARLEKSVDALGDTLIVLLDRGTVQYLDGANQPRFVIDRLDFPLDAQILPDERVLVSEHGGGRVTERNKKNEIVWEKKIDQPLVAQRLASGNTFIATASSLSEVDKTGKDVWTYIPPGGERIMRAQVLKSGEIALIIQQNVGVTRFQLLDKNRKEIRGFGVDIRTSGGRIDVQPNGNILIPENGNNRVLEYDKNGQVVGEFSVEAPIMAMRLPNGNLLATSMNPAVGAVEFDRKGKKIWDYRSDTRVTRAFRR